MEVGPRKLVWQGAIPLHLELHSSEVSTVPPPSPFMTLAPRHGYLPLLVDYIRPHFQSALPPGPDNIWFDYKGLPLKWHIPTGVLFDLLCIEPERPWKLTVHFRAYPSNLLTAYEGSEAAKWTFMNTLKEISALFLKRPCHLLPSLLNSIQQAAYIMYGNTKSVMNLSQSDQLELWRSLVKGDLEAYDRVAMRLRPPLPGGITKGFLSQSSSGETGVDTGASSKAGLESSFSGKIPLKIYVRAIKAAREDTVMVPPPISSWDEVVTLTRPFEIAKQQGVRSTLRDALLKVFPHLFINPPEMHKEKLSNTGRPDGPPSGYLEAKVDNVHEDFEKSRGTLADESAISSSDALESHSLWKSHGVSPLPPPESLSGLESNIKFKGTVRIQGIEPNLDLPIDWIAKNLCGTEHFVHMCVFTFVPPSINSTDKD
ncbi:hypothetical protein O6H91_21G011100 [Diphasiastrum complanatum]|uniref:Uncharacterized protein n=1 Tax=Diphasiastrum complanatum TaxID=34168 RepID=A0ACC2AHS9_DIPCM|nr:hypothetical protein O6H91_21G011100 [Diphasiastrum complanatum]